MLGYNIYLQINNKKLVAVTQDDLTIAARIKESITKDNAGVKQRTVTGHDVSFSVAGLVDVTASESVLTRDDVMALSLVTGSSAAVPVKYFATGGDTYEGSAIITGYSESASASDEDDATYGLNLEINGTFAVAT